MILLSPKKEHRSVFLRLYYLFSYVVSWLAFQPIFLSSIFKFSVQKQLTNLKIRHSGRTSWLNLYLFYVFHVSPRRLYCVYSSQRRSFSLHVKDLRTVHPQLRPPQSLFLSLWKSPCHMQNTSSKIKLMRLLLHSWLLESAVWRESSKHLRRRPQQVLKRLRTVLWWLKSDPKKLKEARRHKGLTPSSDRVLNQRDLGALLLSVLDRFA